MTASGCGGRATRHGDDGHLYRRLTALAWFLATQHNRTANGALVDSAPDGRKFDVGRVAGELQHAFMQTTGDWRGGERFILQAA